MKHMYSNMLDTCMILGPTPQTLGGQGPPAPLVPTPMVYHVNVDAALCIV